MYRLSYMNTPSLYDILLGEDLRLAQDENVEWILYIQFTFTYYYLFCVHYILWNNNILNNWEASNNYVYNKIGLIT